MYVFQCPTCKKKLKFGYTCEPCCTGPNESSDDHELVVMLLLEGSGGLVDPRESEAHAEGPLFLPTNYNP